MPRQRHPDSESRPKPIATPLPPPRPLTNDTIPLAYRLPPSPGERITTLKEENSKLNDSIARERQKIANNNSLIAAIQTHTAAQATLDSARSSLDRATDTRTSFLTIPQQKSNDEQQKATIQENTQMMRFILALVLILSIGMVVLGTAAFLTIVV